MGEPAIDVPVDCFKLSTEIKSRNDFRVLLLTLRFWLVPEYIENSYDVFSFLLTDKQCVYQMNNEFGKDIPYIDKLNTVLNSNGVLTIMGKAVHFGMLGFVTYLHEEGYSWDAGKNFHLTSIAARNGHLLCLRYILDKGCPLISHECSMAIMKNNLDCLEYLTLVRGIAVTALDCEKAVECNNLECVKFIVERTSLDVSKCKKCLPLACACSNVNMIEYLLDRGFPTSPSLSIHAVRSNSLNALRFLFSRGYTWTVVSTLIAVRSGSLECLKF